MAQRAMQADTQNLPPMVSQPVASVLHSFGKPGHVAAATFGGSLDPTLTVISRPLVMPTLNAAHTQRSNLEESTLMKREMENQMAFQNKMRALKQQELNKYRTTSNESEKDAASRSINYNTTAAHERNYHDHPLQQAHHNHSNLHEVDFSATDSYYHQGTGDETDPERSRGISIGTHDDFWNTDIMDDQLFEFLMNN
jgi:hypothetical protein